MVEVKKLIKQIKPGSSGRKFKSRYPQKQKKRYTNEEIKAELEKLDRLWQKHKHKACAIDLEVKYIDGGIAVVGMSKMQNSEPDYQELVAGKNLSKTNLKKALKGTKLLFTYNGTKHDLIALKQEFGEFLPKRIIHIDLSMVASWCGYDVSLKELEQLFGIKRPYGLKASPVALWQAYECTGQQRFLRKLVEYNYHDTVNLWKISMRMISIGYYK